MPEKEADKMASAVKQVGTVISIRSLLRSFGFCAVFILVALLFLSMGLPWYIGAVMFIVAIGAVTLEVITLKRMAGVDLDTLNEPEPTDIVLGADEVLADTVPAVMQYLKARSVSYMGTGKVLTPENALIITNRAVWALTVPLRGADKVVGGVDIGKNQWWWQYKDISAKLQEMLEDLPLEEVLRQGRGKRLLGWEELKEARSRPWSRDICLVKSDGRKYRYSIRLQEDYLRAKEIFKVT